MWKPFAFEEIQKVCNRIAKIPKQLPQVIRWNTTTILYDHCLYNQVVTWSRMTRYRVKRDNPKCGKYIKFSGYVSYQYYKQPITRSWRIVAMYGLFIGGISLKDGGVLTGFHYAICNPVEVVAN